MLCRIKGINSYPSLYVFKTGMVSDKTSSVFRMNSGEIFIISPVIKIYYKDLPF